MGCEIIAYEMHFSQEYADRPAISCIPFEERYFTEYKKLYNACYYDMRKSLDVKPYYFYQDFAQMKGREQDTFLFMQDRTIIGAVSCYGNEIDDLFVNPAFQGKGYGRQLLLWAIHHIREQNQNPVTLHVAEWNQRAISLYQKMGFTVVHKEKVH